MKIEKKIGKSITQMRQEIKTLVPIYWRKIPGFFGISNHIIETVYVFSLLICGSDLKILFSGKASFYEFNQMRFGFFLAMA